jgi:2-polyprenyl-3-methyl-5-hydroxy-6-metoxy-1,4-benzoquinol methylase
MKINTNTWNRWRYTIYPPIYDLVGSVLDGYRKKSIAQLKLPSSAKVLISGAGTGLDLPYLQPGLSITAIDLTLSMLNKLKSRAKQLNLKVDARVMDAQNLSLEAETYDVLILT